VSREIDRFRLQVAASGDGKPVAPAARRRQAAHGGERFLRGPIPWPWLTRAGRLGGRALQVGLVIWHYTAMQRAETIRINLATTAEEFGADRTTMSRGLERLERAGLVAVSRGPGRCHRVTLLALTPSEVTSVCDSK
jgi:hypothetical protein